MRTWFAVAVVAGVVSIASVSFAQAPDGSGVPVAEEGVQPYPTELVDRPIILPHGAEAFALLRTPTAEGVDAFDYFYMPVGGRFGTGRLEFFGGATFLAKQPDSTDLEKVVSIQGGAAFEIGPDQVLRGSLTLGEPFNDAGVILIADGTFELKRKIAPKVALVAAGGLNFYNPLPDEPGPDPLWILSATASGEAQVQLTPTVAGSAFVTAFIPIADELPEFLETENAFDIGVQGTVVLAPNFDLVGGIIYADASDENPVTWFVVGGVVRL